MFTGKIKSMLDFNPKVSFKIGMAELIKWVNEHQENINDDSKIAMKELEEKGLIK